MSRILCLFLVSMISLVPLFFALMICYNFFLDLCSMIPTGYEYVRIQLWQGFSIILLTVVILAILVIVFSLFWVRGYG